MGMFCKNKQIVTNGIFHLYKTRRRTHNTPGECEQSGRGLQHETTLWIVSQLQVNTMGLFLTQQQKLTKLNLLLAKKNGKKDNDTGWCIWICSKDLQYLNTFQIVIHSWDTKLTQWVSSRHTGRGLQRKYCCVQKMWTRRNRITIAYKYYHQGF